jgi:Ser/Thr protein kinase RdoA (MazF antagonist)
MTMIELHRQLLALAQMALAKYDLAESSRLKLINLSENATYQVVGADGRRFALRVHRVGYHSRTAIASELAWLMALGEESVAITPKPVRGLDGEIVQTVSHSSLPDARHVVLFEWEAGVEPAISQDLSKPFEALGEVAARMHLHARRWPRPEWFQRFTWDFATSLGDAAPHWGRWRDGIGVDATRAKLFSRTVDLIGQRLAAYGKNADRFGLVHGDLRLANLLVDGADVKVIDFDDSGFSWFMYDAATTVSFYEDDGKVPALLEAWKTGYRRVAPLSPTDENEIPTFIMLRRLLLVAWIGSHHETDLAKSMGLFYTQATDGLCETYLSTMSK